MRYPDGLMYCGIRNPVGFGEGMIVNLIISPNYLVNKFATMRNSD